MGKTAGSTIVNANRRISSTECIVASVGSQGSSRKPRRISDS